MKPEPKEIQNLRNKLSKSTDYYDNHYDYQTNESNQVIYLNLYDAEYDEFPDLDGDLSFLLDFPELKSLEIEINQELDYSSIGILKNLEKLHINANDHPIDFNSFSSLNLKHLYVEENLQVESLEFISKMADLEYLVMYGKGLKSLEPLRNLKNLKYVILSGSSITDISPIENLVSLENVALSGKIENLELLKNFNNLTHLALMDCEIENCSFLQELTYLKHLSLPNNYIKSIEPLKNLVHLTHLYLSHNFIADVSPLQNCKRLTSLHLNNNEINNLESLSKLQELMQLGLNYNNVKDFSAILTLKKLKYLHIIDNPIEKISIPHNTNIDTIHADNHKVKYIENVEFAVDSSLKILNLQNEKAGFLNRKFIKTDNSFAKLNAFESSFDDYLIRKGDYHFQRKEYDLADRYYNQIKHNPNFVKAKNIEKFLINLRDSKLSDISNDKINEIFSLVNQLKNSNYTNHYNYLKKLKEFLEQENIPYHLKKGLLSKIEGNNLNQNNEEPFINQDFKNVIYVLLFILIGIIVLIKIFSN